MIAENISYWGCLPELHSSVYNCTKDVDISNAASMWVGIAIGALIGLVITWWVYYRQKKISDKQEKVLARMYDLTTTHQVILNKILSLEEKMDTIIERKFPEK
jgi:HAMP domain-containing protein